MKELPGPMPETKHRYATAYCNCGLTWDTRRSEAKTTQDAVDLMRRQVRGHIASPGMQGRLKKGQAHSVTMIEHKIQVFTK